MHGHGVPFGQRDHASFARHHRPCLQPLIERPTRTQSHLPAEPADIRHEHGGFAGRGRARAELEEIRPADVRARRSRRSAMAIRSPEPMLTGPCTELASSAANAAPDVRHVQKTADLPSVRARSLAPFAADSRSPRHQAIAGARRGRTGKKSGPRPSTGHARARILERALHGDLAGGVRTWPAAPSSASGLERSSHTATRDQSYSAQLPAITARTPPQRAKAASKCRLALSQRKFSALLPVQSRRGDPGEVQQVRRLHRLEERIDTAGSLRSACRRRYRAARRAGDRAGPGARQDGA